MKLSKLLKPFAKPIKPIAPALKFVDRRLSLFHRGPFWRRGTLVLVP